MPLSSIIIYFFYLFSCMAPITGALNARAAPLRSAETVFCFSFQPINILTWSFQLSGRVEYYSFLRRRQRKNRLEIKLNELLLLGIFW